MEISISESVELSREQVRLIRATNQCLDPRQQKTLPATVCSLVGVNAQRTSAMALALRARNEGLARADIEHELFDRRSIVSTWVMRGTIHTVPREDLGWLVGMLGPASIARSRGRREKLGLDESTLQRALPEVRRLLTSKGPLTRYELIDALVEAGIPIRKDSQAPAHLVSFAASSGLICFGSPAASGEPRFVLIDDWAGKSVRVSGDEAAGLLARRYLQGYGPADARDLAAWSGLSVTAAKRACVLASRTWPLVECRVEGRLLLGLAGSMKSPHQRGGPAVRLLPAFDPYILGYRDRELLVPEERHGAIYHGGQTVPAVSRDGEVIGTWRYEKRGRRLVLTVDIFEKAGRVVEQLVAEEARDVGRFMGAEVRLEL